MKLLRWIAQSVQTRLSAWTCATLQARRTRSLKREYAALTALSDDDLARLGLTRGVLRRHLRQKSAARLERAAGAD